MAIRIVLADDHALVRQGYRSLLSGIHGLDVVGEAANGREALRLIRALRPDVVLMDIGMRELNGLDATAHASREDPAPKVIIVSMHAAESYVLAALRAGAAGYLLKDTDVTELESAIRAVARGERYLTPSMSYHLIEAFMRAERGERAGDSESLTPRQREILQLIAEGHSSREIGGLLHLSVKTVETHRSQLMQRLQIFDVAGLTRHAIRIGLVDLVG